MYRYILGRIAVLAFFVEVRVKLIFKVEGKKGGQDHMAQIKTNTQCRSPWQFLARVFDETPRNSFFTVLILIAYFLIFLLISVLIFQTIHSFYSSKIVALSLFQTRLSFTLNPAKESRELSLSRFVCNTESDIWISEDFMQKLHMAVTHCSNVHEKITRFSDYMIIFFLTKNWLSPLVLHQIWGSQPNVSLSLLTLVLQNKEHTLRCILMVFHFFPCRLASGIG